MKPRFNLNLADVSQIFQIFKVYDHITAGNCQYCEEFLTEFFGPSHDLKVDLMKTSEDPTCKISLKSSDYHSTDDFIDEL